MATYERIPFVGEKGRIGFSDVFPSLPNPYYGISADDRLLYHTLCTMAGNFSMLLWDKLFQTFEQELNLPRHVAFPYLKQVTANMVDATTTIPHTGPLARGDVDTIAQHLRTLDGDPYRPVYEAFVRAVEEEK